MKSLSSVGLGLSVVFGCLFLALIAEIYYLLWWKRRVTGRDIEDDYYSNPAREFFYILCWKSKKRPYSRRPQNLSSSQELRITANNQPETTGCRLHNSKDLPLKPIDENFLQTGLMVGPPGFLFTIEEESKEELDLESDDGKSRGECKRLSDLVSNGDSTPYVTPLSSPAFFTPPLTPSMGSSHSRSSGYNPFYESCTDVEFSKMRASPPPKFKFLRDAEEKLQKKNTMEEAKGSSSINTRNSKLQKGEEDGSFITIIVANEEGH